jgi:hypothetical chaperone protein
LLHKGQAGMSAHTILGIDFGTSNSAAAWRGADGITRSIALEGDALTLPTALFFNAEDRSVHFGRDAISRYLAGTEGRLMRSLKSLLGSSLLLEKTEVNGQALSFQDIIACFLRELRQRVERSTGQVPDRVMLGRPVRFVDDDDERDALAETMLRDAAALAGMPEVGFQPEPIAAALDFERRITRESLVLVADIGGGTSDFTVVRLRPNTNDSNKPLSIERKKDILSTTGIHIGGTDFDYRLNLETLMPLLGYRHMGPHGREVPSGVFCDLSTWHLIQWRYSARALREANALKHNYTDPALFARLMTVLDQRLGHYLANATETAKIHSSSQRNTARIDLGLVERGLCAQLTHDALASHLAPQLERVVACAQACVAQARLGTRALDAIYLTGGSSSLRPFQSALQTAFAGTPLVEGDVYGGVAAGLACGA